MTVAREFGSGGSDLARALGRRTGWRVVDRGVVAEIARALHVPEEVVEARDEATPRLGERLGKLLAGAFPELLPPPGEPEVDYETVAGMSERILREAASEPPVIIVGHGGMCLFADVACSLHVRVVAPEEFRVEQVMRRLSMGREEALEEIRLRDGSRQHYVRQRFGLTWDDPTLYAMVLNSSQVTPEGGAEAVESLLRNRGWLDAGMPPTLPAP